MQYVSTDALSTGTTRVFSLSVQNSETAPRVTATVVLMPSSRAFPDPHRLYEQRRSRHRHHEMLRISISSTEHLTGCMEDAPKDFSPSVAQ
jgi:hypothetical protein